MDLSLTLNSSTRNAEVDSSAISDIEDFNSCVFIKLSGERQLNFIICWRCFQIYKMQ